MKQLQLAMAGLVLSTALSSCGEVALVAAMQFDLSVTPAQVSVRPGESARLSVTVKRLLPEGTLPVSVMVALADPPSGVTAEPVTVAPNQRETVLTLRVAHDTVPGGPVAVAVRARGGVITKTATTQLNVTP